MKILIDGLDALGVEHDAHTVHCFMVYLDELKKWNKVHNLTAITDDAGIVTKHFLDSLLYLKVIEPDVHFIADVGSGAGFPGLPLAIVKPQFNVYLIEPKGKKAAFLKHMRRLLGLTNVTVINKPVQQLSEYSLFFHVAVVRALFTVEEFIKLLTPYMKSDGMLILSKSSPMNYAVEGITITEAIIPQTDIKRFLISKIIQFPLA
ncbi:MAG: 16S rRNA (guanine(527)-N(7))-methyltransferase RsmG [Candidatus Magnetoovum sp. WYHC-5]|nr:16S rRNA (guanine(527)-N(7))-methyltransferase RsmG [Candidatus Magnetoovum sp. WYHC-5]